MDHPLIKNKEQKIADEKQFSIDEVFDMIHEELESRPQVIPPLKHTFTKGMYCRQIVMAAGLDIVSKWHDTEHQFVVLSGEVDVFNKLDGKWIPIKAPFHGITKPDTRRVLRTITDCVWMTFHPTDRFPKDDSVEALLEAVQQVEDDIIREYSNPLLAQHKEMEGIG